MLLVLLLLLLLLEGEVLVAAAPPATAAVVHDDDDVFVFLHSLLATVGKQRPSPQALPMVVLLAVDRVLA